MKHTTLIFLLAIALPQTASAQEPAADTKKPGALSLAVKGGVIFPQVATELGTTWSAQLEAAYSLMGGRLAAYGEFGFTQPEVSRSMLNDPRVGGAYEGTQTQKELTVGLGVAVRLAKPGTKSWNLYAAIGPRLYFLETTTEGQAAGAMFATNTEQSMRVGGAAALGFEYLLGSFALVLDAQYGTSNLPHLITGEVSTAAVAAHLGAKLYF